MSNRLPLPFPHEADLKADYNPGIRLFGKRFVKEQTVMEFAVEFLAIVFSSKWISDDKPSKGANLNEKIESFLPTLSALQDWSESNNKLYYKPPINLNLKLFAFFGLSPVESRHAVHQEQFRKLVNLLKAKINTSDGNVEEKIEQIEQFMQGFQGVGFNRTWCAQTFFPITTKFLTQETIWNESAARRNQVNSWHEAINSNSYFNTHKHIFMARGGELLYLQLCNYFSTEPLKVIEFAKKLELPTHEAAPEQLFDSLQKNIKVLQSPYTKPLDRLVGLFEKLDEETSEAVNSAVEELQCEWCPQESWQEGLLFAVEINRLMESVLDPVERIELFSTGCALQVLRSLCAQSIRFADHEGRFAGGGILGYSWLFTPADSSSRQQRLASQRNLQMIMGLIQSALRNDLLIQNATMHPRKDKEVLLKEADTRYGHKLFLYLGKKLGIIAPFKGPGARLIMTDELLRYLVLVLLRPGESCEYSDFLKRLYLQYGIAVEGQQLDDAVAWSGLPPSSSVKPENGSWLSDMLRAGGFLVELSDGCSIVANEFCRKKAFEVSEVDR